MTNYNVLLYRYSWILPKGMRFPDHRCSAVTCVSPTDLQSRPMSYLSI